MELIKKYFPNLTNEQTAQLEQLYGLYHEWNEKINVISRKDIDNLYLHHVLHSLSIGLFTRFKPDTSILDFGTGGGFPGIPLAILFPECRFRLIDGTGKKIKVATEIANAIGLKNVEAVHLRGEDEKGRYDYVVSRAVMPLPDLVKIVKKNISHKQINALPNGIICLKGGNINEEIKPFRKIIEVTPIATMIDEEWFAEKNILYLPL
ncbi:MAG: 16S rRNA (guanine(527)-N(7))-methyltransferase RsmG [Prevotella sp.]|jgi:16S rRNA (guanine527-N7)-methyltransferase|nr:16S rRNA (guanine(527)-N(7))-methyltransferase RsmG [Prevotella sp.]